MRCVGGQSKRKVHLVNRESKGLPGFGVRRYFAAFNAQRPTPNAQRSTLNVQLRKRAAILGVRCGLCARIWLRYASGQSKRKVRLVNHHSWIEKGRQVLESGDTSPLSEPWFRAKSTKASNRFLYKSGRGPPHSKTLSRRRTSEGLINSCVLLQREATETFPRSCRTR